MHLSTLATFFLLTLCAQAVVMFTNNAYNGITAGALFTLTWSGDGTVRALLFDFLELLTDKFLCVASDNQPP